MLDLLLHRTNALHAKKKPQKIEPKFVHSHFFQDPPVHHKCYFMSGLRIQEKMDFNFSRP